MLNDVQSLTIEDKSSHLSTQRAKCLCLPSSEFKTSTCEHNFVKLKLVGKPVFVPTCNLLLT